jgi:hypothetical protein
MIMGTGTIEIRNPDLGHRVEKAGLNPNALCRGGGRPQLSPSPHHE